MNISSVNPSVVAVTDILGTAQTSEEAAQRSQLIQAVKTVNESNALGENQELTFVVDRTTHRTLTRIIDRDTQEVVMQIPSEYILRLAEQLKPSSSTT